MVNRIPFLQQTTDDVQRFGSLRNVINRCVNIQSVKRPLMVAATDKTINT